MNIIDQYNDYKKYVALYYPKSHMVEANEKDLYKEIITKIFKSISLLELFSSHEKVQQNTKELIEELQMYFIRFLYVLPLNDYYFVDTLLRAISESILRIVYSIIFVSEELINIKKIKYREMWHEKIKKSDIFDEFRISLSNINNIYGKKSRTVHSDQEQYSNKITYMIDLMSLEPQIKIKNMNSESNILYKFLLEDLKKMLKIDERSITLQQKLILKNM